MFSWVTQNKIWLGNRPLNKDMYFNVPDEIKEYFLKEKKKGSAYVIKDNQILGKLCSTCWYTNISRPKSKKLLMTVLTVAPTTKAKKQQTNELSSILSRYLVKTSFKCITPFTDIIP